MRKLTGVIVAVLALAFGSGMVLADPVVYSQMYDGTDGYLSDLSGAYVTADNFQLSGSMSITDVHWWGVYLTDVPVGDDFTIEFYANSSGNPAATPFASYDVGDVGRTLTGDKVGTYDIYYYSYDLPEALSLSGTTTYYVCIYNNTAAGSSDNWYWARSDEADLLNWYRSTSGGSWSSADDGDLAFQLTAPEPATLLLVAGGMMVLGRIRRRKI